jgi:hypothetical protein
MYSFNQEIEDGFLLEMDRWEGIEEEEYWE